MNSGVETLPIDFGGPADRPFDPFPYAALEGSVVDRFESVVSRYANRPAVIDAATETSYGELSRMVARISGAIAATAGPRSGPVAIILHNDAHYPAAMLGALAANRAYIPLDADHPMERNRLIAGAAGAAAVVSAGALINRVRTIFPSDLPVVDIDDLQPSSRIERPPRPGPLDIATIIYTSGSTGLPKGVYQNHRTLLHDVLQYTNALHLTCEDRLTSLYSPSVSGTIRDIFAALLNGAALHILPPRIVQPAGIVQAIRSRRLTIYHSVPTLFRYVVEAKDQTDAFSSIRIVYLAGDRLDWSDADAFRNSFPVSAHLYVAVGSTECTTAHSHWFVDHALQATGKRMPVGRAIPDRTVTVVGEDGEPVPPGETGELRVTSRYIALGYWQDPELTARAFATDPQDAQARSFRTGDLGLRRPDGLIEFIGRKDQQIKLRGHRIEPGEIESALRKCSGVRDAAVVMRRDGAGGPRTFVAYVERATKAGDLLPRHVLAQLSQRLPDYMVPSTIYLVDELPRLSNFKLDRMRLVAMDSNRPEEKATDAADAMVRAVALIFEDALQIGGSTPDDNWTSLGGNSLESIDAALALEQRFEVEIPPETFDPGRTIREWARWIESRRVASTTRQGI